MSPDDHTTKRTDGSSGMDRDALDDGSESTTSLTARVVDTVAEETGTDPLEMRPLFEYVDPDALQTVLEGRGDSGRHSAVDHVTFLYETTEVTVFGDGRIDVSRRETE